ncbi:alpha-aminoadipic semialdehyde synthase, mitochondrial isoform X1 [Neodiprion pinetum]|uniref:Alpha-aminoadipic semialdehyde synthase, mitochondrial isoform X1 n=2 Tax=Neodiprion lecontei TaxID=441921 RepID=A0ABM3FHU3_NEOLC|nr:alpha-aminoadipic semialdehyde synthase, mitochondrial isoform X1 [Neodiprion fabricii]XP_046412348.1 alpha-aminoadipic semialdehyde synthase, mitochondrial isoform X1 [Neodiprion fabricii]XP_046412349.1 alpha-aminoadipic semialdehyde synthase, mitochondrial isoform X1 [Neodiprion fabricii]XP_046465899.1 alpha-aminoadipic semialdehyde synthase, mitochondrial isoform X1 [Neodiprion pinetum]XP_046465900.1 alpha-aminoadipic semialdehyde synthase, mitochondrial isoform X1 [Neodiprion pinetum]XP
MEVLRSTKLRCGLNFPTHLPSSNVIHNSRYSSSLKGKIIAIRREDQSVWERRAPLAPSNVRRLTRAGVKVIVQPSNRRAYPMQSYLAAGASLQEDISSASVIFGVKQVPVDQLIPNKTYCCFSHTIKAQESNMPLLDAILEKNIRLLDFEKLTDDTGQRVVAFGKYAGVAGMVNILHGLGLRLLALGHHTPFMHIGPAHNYRNSSMARQAIRDAGYEVALGAMPKSIGPLTFVFTGSGNVSQGGQEVFQELPHEYVPPEMLRKVAEHGDINKIYACEVRRRHHLERKEGGGFDPQEYDKFPEQYISTFSKKIAPYASVIINGIYWALDSPKLITIPDAKNLLRPAHTPWLPTSVGAPALPHRMLAICDISADPGGSIEFMNECTTIDTPFCLYDADRNKDTKSFKGPGVLVCSIDNMPTQLPRESTDFFGDLLYPYVPDIIQSDARKPLEEHNFSPAVYGAIIASNGQLTPNFEYIQELRQVNVRSRHKTECGETQDKKVLVLGAGYVSPPLVEYLHRDKRIGIIVGSQFKDEADALANRYPGVESVFLNVLERPDTLRELIDMADVVVSLLPYSLHHVIAKTCIDTRTHMVTASYLNDQVRALHQDAESKGVTILNEVGLDPGIDHLLAMECIDDARQAGGKIESFVSWCGGLPAPECSSNPLRYKFSWSPRGALLNTLSPAKYLHQGQVVEISGGGDLMSSVQGLNFLPGFSLEGFPNRDSTIYKELYGINHATTILRGTLRFKGYSDTIQGMQLLGLIDPNPHPILHPNGPDITWRTLICNLLGLSNDNIFYENLKTKLADRVGSEDRMQAIEDLGLLKEDLVLKLNTPLDTLCNYLSKKLRLEENERDLIILRHDVGIIWPDNKREEKGINLVAYGNPQGHSAMASAVGYLAGIATKMIIDGEIQQRGVILPFTPDIYRPMLNRLRAEGLESFETSKWL